MEKIYKFKNSLYELKPDFITNETGKKFLLAYNLKGIFGNNIYDFCKLNKLNHNLINFCSKNEFYVYCIDTETENYFQEIKTWGINIVNIVKGEKLFFNKKIKEISQTKTVGLIKKGKKIYPKLKTEIVKKPEFEIKHIYKEFFMPHFDRITMNPPYEGDLHLQILECIIEANLSDNIINISPVQWLQNPLAEQNNKSAFKRFSKTIIPYINDIDYFTMEQMAKIFDGIDVAGAIYTINKTGGYDITKLQSKFLNKLKNIKYEKIEKHIESNKLDGWRVRCGGSGAGKKSSTRPNADSVKFSKINYVHHILDKIYNDGYTKNGIFWTEDRLPGAGNKKKPIGTAIPTSIKFNTEEEAKNFVDFTKLTSIQFLCLECSNYNVCKDKFMPWFNDFNKTNKDICDLFKIDGFINDTTAVPGSEWEFILNTMKDYK